MPTRYIDSTDFSTASAVWDSPAKTNKAPNQWYSFCGIARQQVSGALGPVFICGSVSDGCASRCAESVISGYFGTRTRLNGAITYTAGMYRRRITGTSGKAAFRVEITGVNGAAIPSGPIGVQIQQTTTLNEAVNPNQYPLRGISFSNLSAAFFLGGAVTGPIQQRLFGYVNGTYVAPGADLVNEFVYSNSLNPLLNTFSSSSNQVTARLGSSTLFTADPGRGVFYMSPSGGEDIDLIIWVPCSTLMGGTVNVDVFCSNTLREFTAYYQGAGAGGPCAAGVDQRNIFLGNVQNQIGGQIGLYDWAFSDFMANGVRPDGYYYLPAQAGITTHIKIRVLNGIIVQIIDPCAT